MTIKKLLETLERIKELEDKKVKFSRYKESGLNYSEEAELEMLYDIELKESHLGDNY